jgi:hypothetical protein
MPAVKMNLSLDARAAELLREQAKARSQPLGQYVAELVEADARRTRDALMAEGYRELAAENLEFAAAAAPLAAETCPDW